VAISKLSFTKQPQGIKASLRYYVHRPEQSTKHVTREIFGRDGRISKYDAYRMIDRVGQGTTFFRLIISPDKLLEDRDRRLNMREVTAETMQKLQKIIGSKRPLNYIGIEHTNTENRHVHAIFFHRGRISRKQLRELRTAATRASLFAAEQEKEKKQQQTSEGQRTTRFRLREGEWQRVGSVTSQTGRIEPGQFQRTARRGLGRARPPRQPVACPNCESPMTGNGTLWECSYCGMVVGRSFRLRREESIGRTARSLRMEVGRL
jgi:hypothetical protein